MRLTNNNIFDKILMLKVQSSTYYLVQTGEGTVPVTNNKEKFNVQYAPCGHFHYMSKESIIRLGRTSDLLNILSGQKRDAIILSSEQCYDCEEELAQRDRRYDVWPELE